MPPVAAQTQHVQAARSEQQLRASVNHGKPPIAATPKPAAFQGSGVVPAKQSGGPYTLLRIVGTLTIKEKGQY